jgi:hypothetical protein
VIDVTLKSLTVNFKADEISPEGKKVYLITIEELVEGGKLRIVYSAIHSLFSILLAVVSCFL